MESLERHRSRTGEVLRAIHRSPGLTRAGLSEALGLSSGLASDLVAGLVEARWLAEGDPAPAAGRPGRPTRTLWPHPAGPLVIAVAIAYETWRVEVSALGGEVIDAVTRRHDRRRAPTLRVIAAALDALWAAHGERVRGIGLSAPGTVSGTRLVQAANIGWEDVELAALCPEGARAAGVGFRAGNDASDSALAELARGAAEGHPHALVIFMDSGVGGALIDAGRVSTGALGMSGEFGHLPLGSGRVRCRCGARGCWNTELDGPAFARALARPLPGDEVSFAREVIAAARDGAAPERRAVRRIARALGRGMAGLVNAHDPGRVVLCGLASDLAEVAADPLRRAYEAGLMSTRLAAPPPLVPGLLATRGPIVGAAEAAWAPVLDAPAG